MKRIQLWAVPESDHNQDRPISLEEVDSAETEQRLEDILVASPDLLSSGLTLIARQPISAGGKIDLLGVDQDGRIVIFELKRGALTRDAVAQILDYASEIADWEVGQLAGFVEEHSGRHGIEPIEDFVDWYAREHPETELLKDVPRMVLVGLGVDERAKRIVNFLADAGIDVQLLTFHAFRSDGQLLLARQVESDLPSKVGRESSGPTKEENRQVLLELAEQQGVRSLLSEVADSIQGMLPKGTYRYPGKTAYSFGLPERTEEGRPTLRAYVTVYVNRHERGKLQLVLSPRATAVTRDEFLDDFVAKAESAKKNDSNWAPVTADVDARSWPNDLPLLQELLAEVVRGWERKVSEVE